MENIRAAVITLSEKSVQVGKRKSGSSDYSYAHGIMEGAMVCVLEKLAHDHPDLVKEIEVSVINQISIAEGH